MIESRQLKNTDSNMYKITTEQLQEMKSRKSDFAVINVLPEDRFIMEHIPGSENIPLQAEDFVQRVEERLGSKDKDVVVYCDNEENDVAPTAAKKLEAAGFRKVYNFEGGLKAWKQAGLPFETGHSARLGRF